MQAFQQIKQNTRITSYNVCYTKLLRNRVLDFYRNRTKRPIRAIYTYGGGALLPGLNTYIVITSYSIHYTKLYDGSFGAIAVKIEHAVNFEQHGIHFIHHGGFEVGVFMRRIEVIGLAL